MEEGGANLLSQLISSQHAQSEQQPDVEQDENNLHALAAVLATHKGIVAERAATGSVSCQKSTKACNAPSTHTGTLIN
jgi:hypothetical protein